MIQEDKPIKQAWYKLNADWLFQLGFFIWLDLRTNAQDRVQSMLNRTQNDWCDSGINRTILTNQIAENTIDFKMNM